MAAHGEREAVEEPVICCPMSAACPLVLIFIRSQPVNSRSHDTDCKPPKSRVSGAATEEHVYATHLLTRRMRQHAQSDVLCGYSTGHTILLHVHVCAGTYSSGVGRTYLVLAPLGWASWEQGSALV